jgi:hypothetical protein
VRRKKTAGWAVRVSWAGREAEAQWGEGGGRLKKKRKREWVTAGPKDRMGQKWRKNFFSNKNLIFEYTKALEICVKRLRRNFDMRIFPKFF